MSPGCQKKHTHEHTHTHTHTHTLGEYRWSHTRSLLFVCPQRGEYSSCPLSEPPKSYLSSVTVCTLPLSPSPLSALKCKQMWKYIQSSWKHRWQIQRWILQSLPGPRTERSVDNTYYRGKVAIRHAVSAACWHDEGSGKVAFSTLKLQLKTQN